MGLDTHLGAATRDPRRSAPAMTSATPSQQADTMPIGSQRNGPIKSTLDFLVIGAPKSATTTLYEYLNGHPQLALPRTKEAPFFTHKQAYSRGLPAYLRTHFRHAPAGTLWGAVTPHYMQGQADVDVRLAARRIHDDCPDVKLIALLRDPVERAFSHYKMLLPRGYETRSFAEVVDEAIAEAPTDPRNGIEMDDRFRYVYTSEYGRILEAYYDLFPSENILVLTTDELRAEPLATVQTVCAFLGVDSGYRPADLATRHRQGGSRPRLRLLSPGFLYRIPLLKKLWKTLVPHTVRNRVEYRINLWNVKPDAVALDRDSVEYHRLVEFFRDDVRLLERLVGREMPWQPWRKDAPTQTTE